MSPLMGHLEDRVRKIFLKIGWNKGIFFDSMSSKKIRIDLSNYRDIGVDRFSG